MSASGPYRSNGMACLLGAGMQMRMKVPGPVQIARDDIGGSGRNGSASDRHHVVVHGAAVSGMAAPNASADRAAGAANDIAGCSGASVTAADPVHTAAARFRNVFRSETAPRFPADQVIREPLALKTGGSSIRHGKRLVRANSPGVKSGGRERKMPEKTGRSMAFSRLAVQGKAFSESIPQIVQHSEEGKASS